MWNFNLQKTKMYSCHFLLLPLACSQQRECHAYILVLEYSILERHNKCQELQFLLQKMYPIHFTALPLIGPMPEIAEVRTSTFWTRDARKISTAIANEISPILRNIQKWPNNLPLRLSSSGWTLILRTLLYTAQLIFIKTRLQKVAPSARPPSLGRLPTLLNFTGWITPFSGQFSPEQNFEGI